MINLINLYQKNSLANYPRVWQNYPKVWQNYPKVWQN